MPVTLRRLALLLALAAWTPAAAAQDSAHTTSRGGASASVVLAGGCFWGVEAVFEHLRGVQSVTSGYARDARAALPTDVEAVRVI